MAKAAKLDTVITDTGDIVEVEPAGGIAVPEEIAEFFEDGITVPATTRQTPPPGAVSIYASTDPKAQLDEARARAAVLVEVIREQGLAKSFGNSPKPHVFVEGWQFLASQFSLIPDIEWTRELDEGGWEARASLRRLSDGVVIANAEGECRRSEDNWKNRPSYALRSMAQTRAVSKVCRVALSSVMVMAGFAATPAEEMEGIEREEGQRSSVPRSTPTSPDDPHCPACLDKLGTLVAVTGPHDRKPFWRCTAKPKDCGGFRVYQDKEYSWSGWHKSWDNSARDYRGQPVIDDPETKIIDPDERVNHSGYMIKEIMGTAGCTEADAIARLKTGLAMAVEEGTVDAEAALGGPPSHPATDQELSVIVTNLTLAEADTVVGAASF